MYFDSHAHYDDEKFEEDRELLLKQLPEKGISYVVNVAADMPSAYTSVQLAHEYEYIYAAVGVHPHDAENMKTENLEELRILSQDDKVVAIGEIGLDYYYDYSPKDIQKEWFIKQMELAKQLNLPVIVHSRDACKDTFDLIEQSGLTRGVIHCFSGSYELAKEYVKKGFYIGIGGAVTFKNAKKIVEVVQNISLQNILIETDAPYLTPVPHRGKRNDSSYLIHIAEKIAQIKQISLEEVIEITSKNAKKFFEI